MTANIKESRVLIRSGFGIAVAAIGFVALGSVSTAYAQGAGCTGGGKVSKQIAKPMAAAQEAMKTRKWQEVLNKTREAEGIAGAKSQTDLYWMAEFRGYAYHELRQPAEAARELESALNNPCMPEAKKAERLRALVGLYSSLRNYPKAIDFGNKALKLSRDPETQVALAQAYYQSGNNKDAARVMNDLMSDMEKSGGKPKEQQLLLVVSACSKANDNACVARVNEKLVSYYPKPDYWSQLLTSLTKLDTDDIQKLNVMRLSTQVNVMKNPEEYKEMAQLALEDKLAGEAQSVLEQGFSKKIFADERMISVNTRLLAAAKKEAEADKATLAKREAEARAAATGDAAIKVGAQYLGYGDAVKAADLLQKGIAKGGIGNGDPKQKQRVDEASILLGIAHLRNNNKVEAAKAFRSVKQDPTMLRIAKLWLLNT
jgi:thioredoxin-like negative regulator of GroEL